MKNYMTSVSLSCFRNRQLVQGSRAALGFVCLGLMLVFAHGVQAEPVSPRFIQGQGKGLSVTLDGKPFIVSDEISDTNFDNAVLTSAKQDGVSITNLVDSTGKKVTFRREIGVYADRVEVTTSMRQKAYIGKVKDIGKYIQYTMKIPLETLKGAKIIAFVGKKGKLKKIRTTPSKFTNYIRHMVIKKADGTALTFDCNPTGVQSWSPVPRFGSPVGSWAGRRMGKFYEVLFLYKKRETGSIYTGKCVIYPKIVPFENLHGKKKFSTKGFPILSLVLTLVAQRRSKALRLLGLNRLRLS